MVVRLRFFFHTSAIFFIKSVAKAGPCAVNLGVVEIARAAGDFQPAIKKNMELFRGPSYRGFDSFCCVSYGNQPFRMVLLLLSQILLPE